MTIAHLTIRCDEDYLRLVAYRMALKEIVRLAEEQPLTAEGQAVDVARQALSAFGDDDCEPQGGGVVNPWRPEAPGPARSQARAAAKLANRK